MPSYLERENKFVQSWVVERVRVINSRIFSSAAYVDPSGHRMLSHFKSVAIRNFKPPLPIQIGASKHSINFTVRFLTCFCTIIILRYMTLFSDCSFTGSMMMIDVLVQCRLDRLETDDG
jgi:hypothetical protein